MALIRIRWSFLIITSQIFLCFSPRTNAKEIPYKSSMIAADLGLAFLGAITSNQNKKFKNSVVLIKIQALEKVVALRVGFVFSIKETTYSVIAIEPYAIWIVPQKDPNNVIRVLKDGFSSGEPTKVVKAPEPAPAAQSTGVSESYSEDGFERTKGDIKLTTNYRDNLIKNQLGKILMQASAEPVLKENGTIEGFSLDQIEAGSIYEKAGLQNGDIVTSINGIPLNNVTAAIKLLQSLKEVTKVDFEYKRGGQVYPVTIQVN